MDRFEEINKRLLEIMEEGKNESADLDKLTEERGALLEERTKLKENVEKRKALIEEVVNLPKENVTKTFEDPKEEKNMPNTAIEYKSAFLKSLLGEEMNELEKKAFVHTTANTADVMPEELQNKIYSTMEEAHPILKDVQVLRTGAVITIVKHTAIVAGDAKVVAENEANDDEQNTFVNVSLSGKDFSKHVDFSYRLGKMSIPAFEQYLIQEISSRIGAAMARDIVAQIRLDLAVGNNFPAATPGTLVVGDALKGLGLLKQVGKVNIYTNGTTLYNNIATMVDADTKLSFIPNYQDSVSAQLLGKGIKEEDALADGEVLFLDPTQFIYNVVQDIMLERDKDIKKHVHTIAGFAIAEGTLTNDRAGALLSVGIAG